MGFKRSNVDASALAANQSLSLPCVQNYGTFAIGDHARIHHDKDTKHGNFCGTIVGTTRSYVYIQLVSCGVPREVVRKRNDKVIWDVDSPWMMSEDE